MGKNLIRHIPKEWNVVATYHSDQSFLRFVKPYTNVKARRLDLLGKVPFLGTFDTILYLAANSDPRKSITDPAYDLEVNAVGVTRLLSNIHFSSIIYFSSGAVYLKDPLPYCISKKTGEEYVRYFAKEKDAQYVILRLFETYGKYSPKRKIFRRLCEAFEAGKKTFEIYGNGKNLVDPMYIADTVRAIIAVIHSKKGNVAVDLCRGEPLSITEVAKTIAKVYGVDAQFTYQGKAPESVFFRGDPAPMKKLFGFRALTTLSEGIMKWREDPDFEKA